MTAAPARIANDKLREAVSAARAGEKRQARELLRELLEMEPGHEQGLLWAAALAETIQGAIALLERLVQLNPHHEQALKALSMHRASMEKWESPGREIYPAQPPRAAAPVVDERQPGTMARQPSTSRARWQCAMCGTTMLAAPRRCPRCRAMTALDDLAAIAHNGGVDEEAVNGAALAWRRKAVSEPGFTPYLNLALALLNLKRSAEALPWLKKASEARPESSLVRDAALHLERRKLVLAVDDSHTVRKVVNLILEQNGYRVLTAADGMQALARLNEATPDLILLDVTMPRMDGYQVCKVVKQNPYTKKIPVLMLSGNDGFFDKVRGKWAGATDYLVKPLVEEGLLAALEKHLKTKAERSLRGLR